MTLIAMKGTAVCPGVIATLFASSCTCGPAAAALDVGSRHFPLFCRGRRRLSMQRTSVTRARALEVPRDSIRHILEITFLGERCP